MQYLVKEKKLLVLGVNKVSLLEMLLLEVQSILVPLLVVQVLVLVQQSVR